MRFSITGTFAAADGSPLGTRTVPVVLQAAQEVSWSMSMAYGGAAPGHCQMSYTAAPAQ